MYNGPKARIDRDCSTELVRRLEAGESKTALTRELKVDRTTVYRMGKAESYSTKTVVDHDSFTVGRR